MSISRATRLALVATLAIGAIGCDDSSDGNDKASSPVSALATTSTEPTATPPATEAPTTDATTTTPHPPTTTTQGFATTWERVVPGGDCECADKSEFSFYVRKADPTKVVLFFQGGGACFSAETCRFQGGTYKVTTDASDDPGSGSPAGIFDFDNEANPFRDYSFVFVPYCTGDVHIGNAETTYAPDLVVEHKGYVNGNAALAYMTENFPDAQQVVVTGESAGSVPTPLFAGLVFDQLPNAAITVLADGSGAYPDNDELNAGIGALWGTTNAIPDWPENQAITTADWSFPGLFIQAGKHAPGIVFARHDYAFDKTQSFFAGLVGIDAADLVTLIDGNETQIEQAGTNLLSYIAPGDDHTVLGNDRFYTEDVNGVLLVDWVTSLVNGGAVADVHCETCTA